MSAPKKKFRIRAEDIKPLVADLGGCLATDRISVDGSRVGYMYRVPPQDDVDSGWRFMAGDESDAYMDDAGNQGVYTLNAIANIDPDIVAHLQEPVGSAFARDPETGTFQAAESDTGGEGEHHETETAGAGDYALSPSWTLSLPLEFGRRVENGDLVLWRPGLTLYFVAWNNDKNDRVSTRLSALKKTVPPEAFEPLDYRRRDLAQFSYRLVEDGVNALQGFVVAPTGHLQVSIYFDDETDLERARAIFSSVRGAGEA
jgi:hypothetical protein